MKTRFTGPAVIAALTVVISAVAPDGRAATVWNGPSVGFLKVGSDPITVRDELTADVALTRGNAGILFNPLGGETGPGATTPGGTLWAFDTAIGNPSGAAFSASNFAALNFQPFLQAVGGPATAGGPGVPNVVLTNAGILHLVASDIYLDIQFLQWTSPLQVPGSAFEYLRASPTVVPLPAALPLVATSLVVLGARVRRARLIVPA